MKGSLEVCWLGKGGERDDEGGEGTGGSLWIK